MIVSPAPKDRRRLAAVLCASAALLPLLALTGVWLQMLLTLEGGDRVLLLNPLVGFGVSGLLWLGLAIVALVLVRRATRRRLPTALAGAAILLFVADLALAAITLTI
ncbi:hypothetical protein [Arenivirga flava]|uniref:Uncharacterized protein n=1 Tax=Arenivirga flava TaxID=1930060 RepID=A0AA37UIB8_9MICO|nr:hypothetical protein [Arenivirga flava]GMA29509.1 hypothetical protein GCM10025874_27620 [Arenivirga flava]